MKIYEKTTKKREISERPKDRRLALALYFSNVSSCVSFRDYFLHIFHIFISFSSFALFLCLSASRRDSRLNKKRKRANEETKRYENMCGFGKYVENMWPVSHSNTFFHRVRLTRVSFGRVSVREKGHIFSYFLYVRKRERNRKKTNGKRSHEPSGTFSCCFSFVRFPISPA